MTKNRIVLAALAVVTVLVGIALVTLVRATSESAVASTEPTAAAAPRVSEAPALASDLTFDHAKQASIVDPRIDAVHSEADLLHFFDLLEADARARGHVDDELARADLAGKKLLATMPKDKVARRMIDFGDRMKRVTVELRVAPVLAQLDALRGKLATEHDPAKRTALLQQYGQLSAKLDVPTARLAAAEQLKQTLAAN
ncbi:MAG TPA: hypothetical protein VLT45_05735 [Kofleriaceae bacterium]|nr:hypothetical protein [Kofleriaceae bacterium]